MRDILEVLGEKTAEYARLGAEIGQLKAALPLLIEESDKGDAQKIVKDPNYQPLTGSISISGGSIGNGFTNPGNSGAPLKGWP
jgi:hypothetical protein